LKLTESTGKPPKLCLKKSFSKSTTLLPLPQLPQRNGLSHFVIFAENGKNKTYYISLDGFGHAFDIMTGECHAKYQIPD
jgi:hypothetical protein